VSSFRGSLQSVRVEYDDLVRDHTGHLEPATKKSYESELLRLASGEWQASDPANRRPLLHAAAPAIWFEAPTIKVFCEQCDRMEAFNAVSVQDFLGYGWHGSEPYVAKDRVVQVFVASFLCQSCKTVPEVFLVRRHGMKLTLCGRVPMEHVTVPPMIPKAVQSYYSGAIVAHQSGQTLAGLFLLRTLIEQWVRMQMPASDKLTADQAVEKYMAGLPDDFPSQFRTVRSLYGDLSADIHAAKGDPELFDRACTTIVEHFDARRLFKLM
jgi:hypothetical protein